MAAAVAAVVVSLVVCFDHRNAHIALRGSRCPCHGRVLRSLSNPEGGIGGVIGAGDFADGRKKGDGREWLWLRLRAVKFDAPQELGEFHRQRRRGGVFAGTGRLLVVVVVVFVAAVVVVAAGPVARRVRYGFRFRWSTAAAGSTAANAAILRRPWQRCCSRMIGKDVVVFGIFVVRKGIPRRGVPTI